VPLDRTRTRAPDAVQVADRFHLWQNLAKAAERCVAAHRARLAEPDPGLATGPETAAPEPAARPGPCGKYADRARTPAPRSWQELADGRWQGPRPSKLDPFKPYLHEHAVQGRGDGIRLFREITALGYTGSYLVRHRSARSALLACPACPLSPAGPGEEPR
jgi:hypothetical protein